MFSIERSQDGENWSELLTVPGAGTSTDAIDYEAVDTDPFAGISYYRLKQTDFDGQFEYSSTIVVLVGEFDQTELILYPNPANQRVTLLARPVELQELAITDLSGRDVTGLTKVVDRTETTVTLDISRVPEATYILRVSDRAVRFIKSYKE